MSRQQSVLSSSPPPTRDSFAPPCVPDARWERLLAIGTHQARCHQLPRAEVEDCALELVCRLLLAAKTRSIPQEEAHFRNWGRRCAANHARNYQDRLYRRQRRLLPLDSLEPGEAAEGDDFPAVNARSLVPKFAPDECGTAALRREFWETVAASLASLTPLQRAVFLRWSVEEDSVEAIAAALGKTPNAVRLLHARARRRLCAALEGRGVTEGDLRSYLANH